MEIMQATLERTTGSKGLAMRSISAFFLLVGCTASGSEVRPPSDRIFFPTGAAVSPNETHLFVANGNSDLTFDSGSISVFALADLDDVIQGWTANASAPPDCVQDPDFTETLVCPSQLFLGHTRDFGVRIGNFATEISVQNTDNDTARLIIPTRGDPSITWADFDGERLSCRDGNEPFEQCDDNHRLSFVGNDADNPSIPEEPFSAFADSGGQFAMVTHLTSGAITLIDSPRGGNAVVTDIVSGVFAADPNTGLRGATGIAGRSPSLSNTENIIYVGSRSEDRIQTFTVGRPVNSLPPFLLQGNYFFLDAIGGQSGQSVDTRGMKFSPSGDRLYVVNRRPPSLQIIDTSLGTTGFPKNKPLGGVDICRQASTLAVADSGAGERIYVSCFQDGQIYVINPEFGGSTDDIITVGGGPFTIVAAPTRKRVYVTNFLEDSIAVVDIDPLSKTRNRVVLRIGSTDGL
jgi:DNA-binding beta-propeller fold protein YncE